MDAEKWTITMTAGFTNGQLNLAISAHLISLDGSELPHLKERWLTVNSAIWHTEQMLDKLRPYWLWNVHEYEFLIHERTKLKAMLQWIDTQIGYLHGKSG